jgi:hypothetical protein
MTERGELSIESCSDCRYFVPGSRTSTADGTCHRNAPMQYSNDPVEEQQDLTGDDGEAWGVATMVHMTSYFGWPAILASDWCGEFEPRRAVAGSSEETP